MVRLTVVPVNPLALSEATKRHVRQLLERREPSRVRPARERRLPQLPCHDLGGLEVIVAALASPASETATTCFGGTTSISPWEVQNRRSPFALQAALIGRAKNTGARRGEHFPCLFNGLRD